MLKSLKKPLNINNNNGEAVNLCKNMEMNGCDKGYSYNVFYIYFFGQFFNFIYSFIDYNNQVLYQNGKISEENLNENLGLKMLRCFSTHTNNKVIFSRKPEPDALLSIHGIR